MVSTGILHYHLSASGTDEGRRCGRTGIAGGCYTALAVQKINGKMSLQQRTGNWTKDDEVRTGLGEWNSDVIYIQMKVEKEIYRTFYVGTAEENLQPVGQMVEATPGRVGVKDGLFAINEQGMEGGLVAADYFVYQEL